MLTNNISGDAIFIELGSIKIGAIGQFGIAAIVLLVLIYIFSIRRP